MNKISRRSFLKGAAASAAAAAVAGFAGVSAFADDAIYTPGTYTSTAQGIGTVVVTMTFSETEITEVVLNVEGETKTVGQAAAGLLVDQIMEVQSNEIDGVSGATVTSSAVKKAAAKCIAQAKGEIPVEDAPVPAAEDNTPASWLGSAPEIAEEEITDTWETDFLIVGAGNGGLCAGAYAASNGLDFRIIEKGPCHGRNRGWYGAVNTQQILDSDPNGYCDHGEFFRELKRYSSGKCDLSLFNVYYNESAAMHDFVTSVYTEYAPEETCAVTIGDEAHWPEDDPQHLFFPVEEHFWSGAFGGDHDRCSLFEACINDKSGHGVDFNTKLVKLEKNEEGTVTGVIAQKTDTDEYIRINAKNGVLLACGGYPANPAMMEQLDPMGTAVTTYNNCNPLDTGDGIKAAIWAGAQMQGEAAPMLFDRGIVAPGVDAGYQVTSLGEKYFPATSGQFNIGSQPFLKVNRKGERFANESGTYDQMSYAAFNQPGGVYAEIIDGDWYSDVQRFHTIGCSAGTRNGTEEGTIKSLDAKVDIGEAFKADTLEELADMLGFEGAAKDTFLATVDNYNAMYDAGEDTEFGKPFYRMSQLRKAPFYGFWMGACLLTTEQGILINNKGQAKDANGDPINGLYCCGDNAGGFFYNNYPCVMAGIAMGRNMTFAIKVIKTAFGLE